MTFFYSFHSQGDSLSQVFVKFLESESVPKLKPHPLQSPTTSGYIDPKKDPDRPSLATAAILRSPSSHHSNKTPSELYNSSISIPKLETSQFHSQSFGETQAVVNSNQSSLLKNVLSE